MRVNPHRFIDVFRVAALAAGSVARRLQGQVRAENKEGHDTPEGAALSAVDLAAQDVILYLLHHEFPDVAMDAEEDTETARLFPPRQRADAEIVIDPVDGTLSYLSGSADYAVMGALLEGGTYRASLIHYPAHDITAWAVHGEGCYLAHGSERATRVTIGDVPERILVSPRIAEATRQSLTALAADVTRSRCSAIDAAAPVIGRAKAAVSEGRADRRRAIGFLLTCEAGGAVLIGERAWRGEDPEQEFAGARASVAAASPEIAQTIADHLRHLASRT